MTYDLALCGELVSRCFQARTDAHIAHLLTRSYAEHKALNEFYDAIVEVADAFAEAAQGRWGLLKYPKRCPMTEHGNPIDIPKELLAWIDGNREACCGEEEDMEALIDNICTVCASAMYKMRFLS